MKIFFFIFILFSFFSCTEYIDIHSEDSPPGIVIYGEITDELLFHRVSISSSAPYFQETKNEQISGASVTITSSEGEVFELKESYELKGTYYTTKQMEGKEGVSYTLTVSCDFNQDGALELYEATATMQSTPKIDSITVNPRLINIMHMYSVNLYMQEPQGEDYYLCKYEINGSMITPEISDFQLLDDQMFDGQYINGIWLYDFPNGVYKDDFDHLDESENSDIIFLYPDDFVALRMSKIEKGHYQFLRDCQRERRGSNPLFGGPPANIFTNISNGGTGYFSAYSINYIEAIAPH